MAMARRRIILVGDHRQLPHLVQRELEDELISRQSLTEAQAKAYEQSLFERLVKQLREQEKVDNIKRVVMLDTQYRMHPTLGDFISKQFYESVGLDVLHSGRPAQDWQGGLPARYLTSWLLRNVESLNWKTKLQTVRMISCNLRTRRCENFVMRKRLNSTRFILIWLMQKLSFIASASA